jgi:translation initiation factor IF-2
MESEADAREVAGNRSQRRDQQQRALATGPISLEEFAKRASSQAAAELNVILKADVQGSVEAVRQSIEKLSGEKVKVRVLHAAVGGITESDVQLAVASRSIIVGFGVRGEPRAIADAEQSGVQVRFYRVIYELLDDVKKAMVGLLEPVKQESDLGRVEVRETFTIPKIGTIAGCYVTGGTIRRNAMARLLRDSRVIHEGKMSSLRRFKEDVREVQAGFECGIGLEGFNDVKVGDVIEVYEIKEIAPTLE